MNNSSKPANRVELLLELARTQGHDDPQRARETLEKQLGRVASRADLRAAIESKADPASATAQDAAATIRDLERQNRLLRAQVQQNTKLKTEVARAMTADDPVEAYKAAVAGRDEFVSSLRRKDAEARNKRDEQRRAELEEHLSNRTR